MTDNRFFNRSELIGILVLAVFLVVVLALTLLQVKAGEKRTHYG